MSADAAGGEERDVDAAAAGGKRDADGTAGSGTGTAESPVLRTEDLTRRFGELTAVDHVNLTVEAGEFRSVIGPNGAGKTTFFNLVSGALRPTSGAVFFEGEDVSALPPYVRVRRGIGRSFQITNVFGGLSVRENVRLAAQSVSEPTLTWRERLFRSKDSFEGMNDRTAAVLSQIGLETVADERASTLAYGDRRRLEIGLVLATDPTLVLLDEPTAGMSTDETRETMELIHDVLADRTLLLIEHDIDLVMNVSDKVTVLNRGSVLVTGRPEEVADDVSLTVEGGEVVALVGRNGAGKTTTLRSIVGSVAPWGGTVRFDGVDVTGISPTAAAKRGIALVPEERRVFPGLSVRENLRVAQFGGAKDARRTDVDEVFERFENLAERQHNRAANLSGGEQQMLAIARALVGGARLLLLDEPTEGLAPIIVERVADLVRDVNDDGITVLLVEQNLAVAMDLADRIYILDMGTIVFEGTPDELDAKPEIRDRHLGVSL